MKILTDQLFPAVGIVFIFYAAVNFLYGGYLGQSDFTYWILTALLGGLAILPALVFNKDENTRMNYFESILWAMLTIFTFGLIQNSPHWNALGDGQYWFWIIVVGVPLGVGASLALITTARKAKLEDYMIGAITGPIAVVIAILLFAGTFYANFSLLIPFGSIANYRLIQVGYDVNQIGFNGRFVCELGNFCPPQEGPLSLLYFVAQSMQSALGAFWNALLIGGVAHISTNIVRLATGFN